MYLSQTCHPRQSVFDQSRRDVVLNISDLLEDRIDPYQFFEENYISQKRELCSGDSAFSVEKTSVRRYRISR